MFAYTRLFIFIKGKKMKKSISRKEIKNSARCDNSVWYILLYDWCLKVCVKSHITQAFNYYNSYKAVLDVIYTLVATSLFQ